jgi:hypothetical protein
MKNDVLSTIKERQKKLIYQLTQEKLDCLEKIANGFDNKMDDVAYSLCSRRLQYVNELLEDTNKIMESRLEE